MNSKKLPEFLCLVRCPTTRQPQWERVPCGLWRDYIASGPRLACIWKIPQGDPSLPLGQLLGGLAEASKLESADETFAVILETREKKKKVVLCPGESKAEASNHAIRSHPDLKPRVCLTLAEMENISAELHSIFQPGKPKSVYPNIPRPEIAEQTGQAKINRRQVDSLPHHNRRHNHRHNHHNHRHDHNDGPNGDHNETWNRARRPRPDFGPVPEWDKLDLREFLIGHLPDEEPIPENLGKIKIAKSSGRIVSALLPCGRIIRDSEHETNAP